MNHDQAFKLQEKMRAEKEATGLIAIYCLHDNSRRKHDEFGRIIYGSLSWRVDANFLGTVYRFRSDEEYEEWKRERKKL